MLGRFCEVDSRKQKDWHVRPPRLFRAIFRARSTYSSCLGSIRGACGAGLPLASSLRSGAARMCAGRENPLLAFTPRLSRAASSEGSTYLLVQMPVWHASVVRCDFGCQPSPCGLWASLNQTPGLVSFRKELSNSH